MTTQNSNETDTKSSTPSSKYPHCWPMVRITWMDAMDGDTGWVALEKMMKAKLATCVDVGWMIRNDDKVVVIIGSWCLDPDEKEGGRYITIPKGWVKKIEYLEKAYGQVRD